MRKNSNSEFKYIFKIILIGDPFVGKSAILSNFLHDSFTQNYDVTVGVEFGAKTIKIDDIKVKLQIWDTAGQESFKSITRSYYRSAAGAVVAFDLTNKQSFTNVSKWLEECRVNGNNIMSIILIGNKNDLPNREVSQEDINELINSNNLTYLETSAKSGNNIKQLFETLGSKINKKIIEGKIDLENENLGVKPGLHYLNASQLSIKNTNKRKNKNNCCK